MPGGEDMLKYTLILGSVLVVLILILLVVSSLRKKSEMRALDKQAVKLANSERAQHMKKTVIG